MAQQTAVEWLVDRIKLKYDLDLYHVKEEIRQANQMFQEQIVNADLNATIRTAKGFNADVSVRRVKELAEEYYNETYNK
jgi:hypothetical protein